MIGLMELVQKSYVSGGPCPPFSAAGTSGFKGVNLDRGKFRARITVNRQKLHLGFFDSPELAAIAYDKAAAKYHGEFAHLNFPQLQAVCQ